ncbi:hypothetical protein N9T65_00240 [Candidatus Pelagibacter sp.]|nr:hypothetical protein [Candidatus Pelagibacter sp.]MDA9663289.1 hypothetical protein [Candidatus Pelagibacter sp.]
MEFRKKTSIGQSNNLIRLSIKILALFAILFFVLILIDKIDFPSPNKKIEKIIPNENFKVVK